MGDDDGIADVRGMLSWQSHQEEGKIAWQEFQPHGMTEANGVIRLQGGLMVLHANYYCSSTGVSGVVNLTSQTQGVSGPQMPMELQPLQNLQNQAFTDHATGPRALHNYAAG